MEYKIAHLNLRTVNLISGDNDKQDGYFATTTTTTTIKVHVPNLPEELRIK
jgi:hypothetical protein